MAYIYSLADTWNASGTTFTGIGLNVTDTASNAASLLMDLQVGGSTKFKVDKAGTTTFSGNLQISNNGVYIEGAGVGTVRIPGIGGYYGWTTNTASTPTSTIDLILARDAANTLAQRNGVNAQAFNLYNTYTDASNYERGFMRFVSNVLQIGSDKLGTGTARDLAFQTDGATRVTVLATGDTQIQGSGYSSRFLRLNAPTPNRDLYIKNSDNGGGGLWVGANASSAYIATDCGNSQIKVASSFRLGFSSNAIGDLAAMDAGFSRSDASVVSVVGASFGGGAMQFAEMTAPAAPATNNVRIYAEDNGSGKTRLMALFATGVAQQIAIEP